MADAPAEDAPPVDGGSYDVIRRRLHTQAGSLETAARALNAQREATFGGSGWDVRGQERVRTEHNSRPVDMVAVEGGMLVGYHAVLGLKQQTTVDDVFQLYDVVSPDGDGGSLSFPPAADADRLAFLRDPNFARDLTELFQYYKSARLTRLRRLDGLLLAVFQVGERVGDVRVLRWQVDPSGHATYVDNRGERDHVSPPAHDFTWTPTSRDDHILGRHPHINVLDTVFVETVGGDLTIKVEDNTASGEGVYAEPVDDPNQSLDDADVAYARQGSLILLRIKPFREDRVRYLVFNANTRRVLRADAIGQSCVALPEDHGILFPGGYVLRDGEQKLFDAESEGLRFARRIDAPNGEDVLFVFHRPTDGLYALYPYNLIRKEVRAPIHAHGWSRFPDGTLAVFRATDEPKRVHPLQVWTTPLESPEHAATKPQAAGLLGRIGNQELVRGVSDALTLVRLARSPQPTRAAYEDLAATCLRFLDAFHWAGEAEVGDLRTHVDTVRRTAELIVDEFEKVQALTRRAREVLTQARADHDRLISDLRVEGMSRVADFLDAMARLRHHRGHLITLQDTRHIDRSALVALEEAAGAHFDRVGRAAVAFLEGDKAFAPLLRDLAELEQQITAVTRAVDLGPPGERVTATAEGVDLLAEVVAGLEVDDPNRKTLILDRISEVFSAVHRVRATLDQRRDTLRTAEGEAAFGAQLKLLGQAVQSALARCDTPEDADTQLSRLMLQLEELEARFGEFDAFLPRLAEQREEIHTAFAARTQRLLDDRRRKVTARIDAADRILSGLARRAATFPDEDTLNSFFAADPMVSKLRSLAEELDGLGDTVKAEDVRSRLLRTRQDALRGLRDKLELFDADQLVQLGRHKFSVSTQALDLALVARDGTLELQVPGTEFRQVVPADPAIDALRPFWDQPLVSETDALYRGEYLAGLILDAAERGQLGLSWEALERAILSEDDLVALVRTVTRDRYDEGYDRGVHDVDAAKLLARLVPMRATAGLLRFATPARALALLFWAFAPDLPRDAWIARARALGRLREGIGPSPHLAAFVDTLRDALVAWHATAGFDPDGAHVTAHADAAAAALFEVLAHDPLTFTVSAGARTLVDRLHRWADDHEGTTAFDDRLRPLADRPAERFDVLVAWMTALAAQGDPVPPDAAWEAAAWQLAASTVSIEVQSSEASVDISGLLGRHPRVTDGTLTLSLPDFLARFAHHQRVVVTGVRAWRDARHTLLATWRRQLRLDELEPRVMSAFVRNKLIQDVYLPILGDNLAKQIGAAGAGKRTDLMGLLLLVSPPGYGKTTLMEYVAHRLGLIFVKVNGPALGHGVTSLDPDEAPNATARQEVNKINLALEMGNNVLLYLDDIQHTHSELLQKFISLCDASRRIEGVWNGRTRTYDLRGRKFAVVMAGNPYTETGDRFQIPDMLANRADTYNLGDVLSGRDDAFALSFIENALTSNPVLKPLSDRAQADVYTLVRLAQGEELPASALQHDYTAVERNEILAVLRHLFRCRDVLLKVNAEYVRSAAMEDAFRTEPRFQLQGSYRNMAKIAEKLVAAMTVDEVEALLDDHYRGEAQTLTTGTEFNLLRLAELRERLTAEQSARLDAIRAEYRRQQLVGGGDDDPAARVAGVLSGLVDQVGQLGHSLRDDRVPTALVALDTRLGALHDALGAADGTRKGLDTVARVLRAVHDRLAERPAPDLSSLAAPLARIGDAVSQAASAPRPADAPAADGRLTDVLAELRALRDAMRPTTPDAADALDVDARRARLLDQARRAVGGDLRRVDDGGDPTLAAALSVIEMLTVHMVAAARSRLPEDTHDAYLQDLRRTVASAIADLAGRTARAQDG